MAAKNYDFVLSSPFPNYDFFAHRMRELCGQLNLTFFPADEVWVNDFLHKLQEREVSVRVLLDLSNNQTNPEDPFLMLAKEAKRQGTYVINDPDITSVMAHKAMFHQIMLENHILVPETIIVDRKELKDFRITDDLKARVGVPFVVKPAWGDSSLGVILNGRSRNDILKSAEQAPNSSAFLVQRRLNSQWLGSHKGWFRMFHIIDEVIACWWDPSNGVYQMVTPAQRRYHKLAPLARIIRDIARVSKMKLFTSEICLEDDGEFYVIDYINADPDMNPRSYFADGVPDELVRHIVWMLVMDGRRVIMRKRGYFDSSLEASHTDRYEKEQLQQGKSRKPRKSKEST
ncbi:RimK family alpha-L-glutamate ligase [Chloroflexota bacterium]